MTTRPYLHVTLVLLMMGLLIGAAFARDPEAQRMLLDGVLSLSIPCSIVSIGCWRGSAD